MGPIQLLIIVGVAASTVFLGAEVIGTPQPMVLSAIFTPSPFPTIIPTPTTIPTPKPTRVPTRTPSPTPTPTPKFTPAQIYEMYNQAAIHYSVNPDVLRHIAKCESGFNPNAKHHIYTGLYQFDTRTWVSYRNKMGLDPNPDLRTSPEAAIPTAAYVISLGHGKIWPNCYPK